MTFLFRPQRLYRSDFCRFSCWNKARQRTRNNHDEGGFHADIEANCRVNEHRCLEGSRVNLLMSDCHIHVFIRHNAQYHARISKECGDDNTLDDDEFQYRPRSCSYGFANSELSCSLLNRDEHDVRNAHNAT